jgi:hypothetical protein
LVVSRALGGALVEPWSSKRYNNIFFFEGQIRKRKKDKGGEERMERLLVFFLLRLSSFTLNQHTRLDLDLVSMDSSVMDAEKAPQYPCQSSLD